MRSKILKNVLEGKESSGEYDDPFRKNYRAHITVWYNGEPLTTLQSDVSEHCTESLQLLFKDKITVQYERLST